MTLAACRESHRTVPNSSAACLPGDHRRDHQARDGLRFKRQVILAAVIGMSLGGLAGMTAPALAQSVEVNGSGAQRDVSCEGQDVEISGREHRVTLTGTCGTVTVQGSGHHVSFTSASRLLIYGRAHAVAVSGSVGELAVAGAEHQVRTEIAASPDASKPAEVTLSGRGSMLRIRLAGATRIAVAGADHRVLWTKADGVPDPDGTVTGRNNIVRRDDGTQ